MVLKLKTIDHLQYSTHFPLFNFFCFLSSKRSSEDKYLKRKIIENEIMEFFYGLKKKYFNNAFNMWKQKMKKLIDNEFKYFKNNLIYFFKIIARFFTCKNFRTDLVYYKYIYFNLTILYGSFFWRSII